MGKRETLLLVLIASFFTLLIYISSLSNNSSQAGKNNTVSRELFKAFGREVTVFLTGDIMLGRSVMTKTFSVNDFRYPFLKVVDKLKEADIIFSNLESPFVENCPRTDSGMKFCADGRNG